MPARRLPHTNRIPIPLQAGLANRQKIHPRRDVRDIDLGLQNHRVILQLRHSRCATDLFARGFEQRQLVASFPASNRQLQDQMLRLPREFKRDAACLGRILSPSNGTVPQIQGHRRQLNRRSTAKPEQSSDDDEKNRRGCDCHLKNTSLSSACFSAESAKVLKARTARTEVVQPLDGFGERDSVLRHTSKH